MSAVINNFSTSEYVDLIIKDTERDLKIQLLERDNKVHMVVTNGEDQDVAVAITGNNEL